MNNLISILGILDRLSDPATFFESIIIPAATIVYASSVANRTTFEAIATGLGGFALGLALDNDAANFLFRLRFAFDNDNWRETGIQSLD